VKAGYGVAGVVLAGQERGQLELGHLGLEAFEARGQLPLGLPVARLVDELVKDLGFLEAFGEVVISLQVLADPGQRGGQLLGAGGVVPEAGVGELLLELLGLPALSVEVKGTPSRSPAGRRDP
jgi:hypothetical protein